MAGRMQREREHPVQREFRLQTQMQNATMDLEALVTPTQALRVSRVILEGWFAGREAQQEMES